MTGGSSLFSPVAGAFRLALFLGWTLVAMIPYSLITLIGWRVRESGMIYWKGVAGVCRITVRSRGSLVGDRPLLVVANHSSYLDIVVLGTLIPGVFVAKAEVGGWPIFGWMAKLARTIFIDRKRSATGEARAEILKRLAGGEPLILFPEGTSNDGNRVYPFKSALFSVAQETVTLTGEAAPRPVVVQPVSLAYTRVNGMPMGRGWRQIYAWYGDMDLFEHLFALLGFGALTAEVIFHDSLTLAEAGSRKALSDRCHKVVADGLRVSLRGGFDDPPVAPPPPGPPESLAATSPESPVSPPVVEDGADGAVAVKTVAPPAGP
ncbi:lysophospholipid acyltransferase family protein [Rhodospirillum rubrum]|uniref:Lyso-ornithine lipid acyltransferase n=1 Tax=Rhodospirillum rubrum (strain ATCC 11170 / ATH 1.1.1 / DSM 467 / LMG 4362 / NCIMB 8255 / S1) TaxID=269796 RepID=Q2RMT2_RHORT|nr:lysophospholipid acyltransferase family protein [Rhodospirillum rubrum]ABC24563.1 lyso-ornithine lipid acyltransferase [Rhodospirillum rubrum ATCC 11170]AEO50316.1 lyso-ornithine lipid acyltransferase [Rhodospirillum rubrum F11]MBK5956295.1 1-acyl-sn-glycerol-3-phosphate acyltransferase [Rhodospirillum rubrum]QXG80477.1 1-acyl-sn-glycerol-3-phosphate acyltransferase [Rhodospirillum rubrum]HAQ01103.1 1-acyl-sn-glycerol-3-phosphate acyltransferase [Rhodospirillum rubrum]